MLRIPTHRKPTHPGEMLREEFLNPMGLTAKQLAKAIHASQQEIADLVEERNGVTPSIALRLAKYFGTSPGFWMNLQLRRDLYFAGKSEEKMLQTIQPYQAAPAAS